MLALVVGKRTKKNTRLLVQKTAKVLGNKPPRLITSDEWKAYEQAILEAFGERHVSPPTGVRGRPRDGQVMSGVHVILTIWFIVSVLKKNFIASLTQTGTSWH